MLSRDADDRLLAVLERIADTMEKLGRAGAFGVPPLIFDLKENRTDEEVLIDIGREIHERGQ